MSSFFTAPASQRKRKRDIAAPSKPRKRRDVEYDTAAHKPARASDRGRGRERRREQERARDRERDESISGSDSDDHVEAESGDESAASSEEEETAADRRVRLAQRYLDNIRHEVDETGFDAEDLDRDLIAQRLKEDVDEAKGRQYRLIATTLDFAAAESTTVRANTQCTTGVAVCPPYAYTVSRDKVLIKWQLQTPAFVEGTSRAATAAAAKRRKKPRLRACVRGIQVRASAPQQHGHTGAILAVAASPDGQYVATGGADRKLIIWAADDLLPLKTFTTHRDGVTGLAFAPKSAAQTGFGAQLFSTSMDRSLKVYSLAGNDSLAYVETLFGHQDHIVDVSPIAVDQCVTVGARDRKALWWKVVDESLTKFLGDSAKHDAHQTGSLDCVAALPPQHFVTGSDAGTISLWSVHKKKALFTVQTAHGVDEPLPLEEVTSESDPAVIDRIKRNDGRRPIPRAITALAALPNTDVVVSGSWDGWLRVWKLSDDKRSLIPLGTVGAVGPAPPAANGHVNGGAPSPDAASTVSDDPDPTRGPVKGIVNSLAVFERRRETVSELGGRKEGESRGVCIVAGIGKEMRLGRWMKLPHAKNGAVIYEIPLRTWRMSGR